MSKLSPETEKLLLEFMKDRKRRATTEDLKKILEPLTTRVVEEQSPFIRKAREALRKPKETKKSVKKRKEAKPKETKPSLSPLEQAFVWFTTKIEEVRQQVEGVTARLTQGHKSGVNADMVDDLHAQEIAQRALDIMQAGKQGGMFALNWHHTHDLSLLSPKDHDLLDGLTDDDHAIYAFLAGRAGGQTLVGGTASGEDLTLSSTSHATKGTIISDSDLDLDGNNLLNALSLQTTNLEINELDANTLRIVAKGTTTYKHLNLRLLGLSVGFTALASSIYFSTRQAGAGDRIIWQARDTGAPAWRVCAELYNSATEPYFGIPRAGDISFLDGKFPIIDKASGNGIKVDTATPTFGWRDLLGQIRTRGVGGTDPNDAVYIGNIKAYQFAVNDECWVDYHIPHDYVEGTDIFLHFHWSHNNALVTGGAVTWGADITYAKGHDQAPFPATVNTTIAGNASTTQYQHIITEIQISTSGGAAGQIDTDLLEPDGVIMIRGYLSANNITVSGGGVPEPFLHFKDIHYQSTNIATKDKVPDFYT